MSNSSRKFKRQFQGVEHVERISYREARKRGAKCLMGILAGLALLVALAFVCVPAHAQSTTNTFNVYSFRNTAATYTVGDMTVAAQAQCQPNLNCIIIFDPILGAFPAGNMPSRCANCTWLDYRVPGTYFAANTLAAIAGTAIPAIGLDPLAAPYNCKFDGVTDDSSCLQAAMTAAINANSCLILPAGQTAVFATTLTANVGNKGSCVRGKGLQPSISGFSVLKYTGAGSAVSFSNSNAFIFGVNWDSVVIMAGANATNAVNAVDISEFAFKNVGIWDDGTHKFTNGWNCQGCNIGTWDRWIVENITNSVVMTDTAQSPSASLTFIHGDTFQVTNVFAVTGQGNNISDIAGWHETQNVVLLIDDSAKVTSLQSIYFDNTRVLFNGAIATYPDSVFMKVNNVAGNVMALHQVNFDHCSYNTNQTVAYPYIVNLANAGSTVWLGIGGNTSHQGATTGLINSTLAGSSSQLRVNIYGMESLNASLSALSTLVGGTGALFTDVEFNGISSNQAFTASSFTATGVVQGSLYKTAVNCASTSGACGSAQAGSVSIAAAATTVTVTSTNLSANSEIFVFEDSSLGARLGVTCNTTTGRTYTVTSRTAATSFVITASAAPVTNPACLNYFTIN